MARDEGEMMGVNKTSLNPPHFCVWPMSGTFSLCCSCICFNFGLSLYLAAQNGVFILDLSNSVFMGLLMAPSSQRHVYMCDFSLCCRPNDLWLNCIFWFGCCLFDSFPIFILYFINVAVKDTIVKTIFAPFTGKILLESIKWLLLHRDFIRIFFKVSGRSRNFHKWGPNWLT